MATYSDIIFEVLPNTNIEEMQFQGGDFLIKLSDQQHIQHILKASKGQYYQHPLTGLGIDNFKGSSLNPQFLQQEIKTQLKADNIQPKVVDVKPDFTVNIDAVRIK